VSSECSPLENMKISNQRITVKVIPTGGVSLEHLAESVMKADEDGNDLSLEVSAATWAEADHSMPQITSRVTLIDRRSSGPQAECNG
jgi:hypothetical protein